MRKLKFKNKKKKIKKDEEENHLSEISENDDMNLKRNKNKKKNKSSKEIKTKKNLYFQMNIFFLILLICETIILFVLYIYRIINNEEKNDKIKSRNEALKSGKKFLQICNDGLLINNNPIIINKNPIISVVLPIYKPDNNIKSTIRSIQNQDMMDFEIIIVYDLTNDNSIKIIEDIQKEDPRIKIIYNNKTMGQLYSRCIGVLEAKGKYITTIDSGEIFCDKDVFDIIYNNTNENYYDIISFRGFLNLNSNFEDYNFPNIKNTNNSIIKQPELGIFPINENNPLFLNNMLLSGKLIKSGVYRAAVNILGNGRYSTDLNWSQDACVFFIICNIAQTLKFIDEYGLFFFKDKTSNSNILKDDILFGEVFLIDIIFDYSKNAYKNIASYKIKDLKNKEYFSLSNEKIKNYLKIVLKKIMICDYIEENNKNEIRKKYEGDDLINLNITL